MKARELIPLIVFVAVMLIAAYLIRENAFFTFPILQGSRLFFQLLVASLVIALLRNVVGLSTFGIFGPMIVAIVFLQAGLLWGFFLFFNVFIVAYGARVVFDPFKLPGAHRVAIIIATVSIYVSLIEIVGEFYHIKQLEFSILFPLLITSWLGDRFVTVGKERGWYYPMIQFLWTTVAVVTAFLVMDYKPLIDFILVEPFTWVAFILLNVLFGVRTRFRLSEYHRFRWLNPKSDVLTMPVRNREFIEKYNPREVLPYTEKAVMRERLASAGVAVPRNLFLAQERKDLSDCGQLISKLERFVVKPSQGFGGEGILIVKGRSGKNYVTSDGREIGHSEIMRHIALILDGHYSRSPRDTVLVERLIVPSEFFASLSNSGLPDVRVIVFQGFTVMSMIRVPTILSKGKANLHMGAVAIGVKLSSGRTFRALYNGRLVGKHPDTGAALLGLEVPTWRSILEVACRAQDASGLGYAGVDVVVDQELGPLVLEVNKRPGLAIQIVNGYGLKARLRFVEKRLSEMGAVNIQEKMAMAMSWANDIWERNGR